MIISEFIDNMYMFQGTASETLTFSSNCKSSGIEVLCSISLELHSLVLNSYSSLNGGVITYAVLIPLEISTVSSSTHALHLKKT